MIIERQAVRAILLTPQNEVLLLRVHAPGEDEHFWITPGGGLEPGETAEDGLRRELQEELGLDQFVIGPMVWRCQRTFNWAGQRICQREQYYVVHAERFEPEMNDANEASYLDRFQWWPVAELSKSRERLTPLSLAEIIRRNMTDGTPHGALELEVLVD